VDFETSLRESLDLAASRELLRVPGAYEPLGSRVVSDGHVLVSFASNDYLGLADAPALQGAIADAALLRAGGTSSRVVVGTSSAHRAAEATLAELVGLPTARVFSSAYAANVGLLGSLFGSDDVLLSDSLNHASLIDGCRLSRARVEVFRHRDVDHLSYLLRKHARTARVTAIITETVFSMDGDIADVAVLERLARDHGAALVADEAHALGVVGPSGSGICALADVRPDVLVGGLGKSFGLAGGFLAGSATLGRAIDNFVRTYVFSTAILPPIAHAIPVSVSLLRDANDDRARLARHAGRLRDVACDLGCTVLGAAPAAIVPIVIGSADDAVQASAALRSLGLLVPAMRPPTVPDRTARLRITPTARHSEEEISMLCTALRQVLGSPGDHHHEHERDHPQQHSDSHRLP